MRILIIANPTIGINTEKRTVITRIRELFTKDGTSVDTAYSYKPGQARRLAARAVVEGYDAVFAAGGDGTINDVASGLVGTDVPLGIAPLGTGNGLARGLSIPLESDRFIEVLKQWKIGAVDAGKIGPSYFFATAGIGFDSEIAHEFNVNPGEKRSIGRYISIGVKHYFLGKSESLTLIADGTELKRKAFALTIANTSQYGGGAIIAPQASPASGKLIAVVIPKLNPLTAPFAARKLFDGTADQVKQLEFIEFSSLKIIREQPGRYHVDGEVHDGTARLNVNVHPASLHVILP